MYDFALRTPSERIPILSVSEFEALLKSPALVWLKKYLGLEGADDDSNPWSAATGQWVHRWLAQVAGINVGKKFVPLPAAADIDRRISGGSRAEMRGDQTSLPVRRETSAGLVELGLAKCVLSRAAFGRETGDS